MRCIADVICGINFGEGYDTTNPELNELLKLNIELGANHIQWIRVLDFFAFA